MCLGYEPQTGIQEGIRKAIAWYSRVDTIAISKVARPRPSSLRTSGLEDRVEMVLRKDTAQLLWVQLERPLAECPAGDPLEPISEPVSRRD